MRLALTDFRRGLWTVGGKETTMQSFIRRARGMHAVRTPSLRSRSGSTELYATANATQFTQFATSLYYVAGIHLYKDGVSIYSGITVTYPRFIKIPPQPGVNDSLFVVNSNMIKVNTSDVVQRWGIAPPGATPVTLANSAGGSLSAGTYFYYIVYLNSVTGSRSNPGAQQGRSGISAGDKMTITTIPIASDTQVNAREIYRTVANGARYFRVATINDNTTTSYVDTIADTALQSFEVQFDNIDVSSFAFKDAWVTNDRRVWWLNTQTGTGGRVYYSPPGRPESVRGFIDVGPTDEFLVRGLSWNAANWVFSETKVYRIFGDDEPFVAIPIDGVPGTSLPEAITITPYGIAYLSYDGVYLFDGSQARLIGYNEIAPLFRGEATENLLAVVLSTGTHITYANNQLYLAQAISDFDTDGVLVNGETLVFDFQSQTWRDLGLKIGALYKESNSRTLVASFATSVYQLEVPGTVDDDTAGNIALEWEVGGALTDIAHYGTLQRVYVDINTGGANITVKAIVDGVAVTLSTAVNTTTRTTVELPMPSGWQARVFSIRLSGAVSAKVELFTLAVDVKLEGGDPVLGVG